MKRIRAEAGKVHVAGQVLNPDEALEVACTIADAVKEARQQRAALAEAEAAKVQSDLSKARERVRELEAMAANMGARHV